LAVVLVGIDLPAAIGHAGRADPLLLLAGIPLKGASFVFMAARTRVMLRPVRALTWADALRSTMLGFVGNNLLPLRGGDLLRIGWLARDGATPASCAAAVGTERLIDLVTLVLLFLATLSLGVVEVERTGMLVVWVVGSVGAMAGAIAAARHPVAVNALVTRALAPAGPRITGLIAPRVTRFLDGLAALRSARAIAAAFGLAVGVVGTWWLGIALWLEAFDAGLAWYAPSVVLAFSTFGQMLPSAPGAIGTYHYFVTISLVLLGLSQDHATSVAIVGHALSVVPWTVLGVAWLGLDALRPSRA